MGIFSWAKKKVSDLERQREENQVAKMTSPGYLHAKQIEQETYEAELSRLREAKARRLGVERAHQSFSNQRGFIAKGGSLINNMFGSAKGVAKSYGRITSGIGGYSAVSPELLAGFGFATKRRKRR